MFENNAPSNAQADAQALLTTLRFSNARTHARDLQRTTYVDLETHVSVARGGAEENWPEVGERWPVLRTARTEKRKEIPQRDRIFVFVRDGFYCQFCGESGRSDLPGGATRVQLVCDHVVPWSAGGGDHVNNLRTLCWDCNEQRSNFRTVADAAWNPLPATYECLRCNPELSKDEVELAFCYHHRTRALGVTHA